MVIDLVCVLCQERPRRDFGPTDDPWMQGVPMTFAEAMSSTPLYCAECFEQIPVRLT